MKRECVERTRPISNRPQVFKLPHMVAFWALLISLSLAGQETVHRTFNGAKSIEIDNVFGSIRVTGYDGAEVQLDAHRTLTADSTERAEAANREVKLDMTQSGGDVRAYVDGPFRCHCEERPSFRSR